MGSRAGVDRCGKFRPPPGFDPGTVQPVTSRYTDYATWPTNDPLLLTISLCCCGNTSEVQLTIKTEVNFEG